MIMNREKENRSLDLSLDLRLVPLTFLLNLDQMPTPDGQRS